MKTQPLVSVIVTTYNNENTLKKCLESIKEQTYPNIELIVVDNYSTDKTREIAKKFTKKVYLKKGERSIQRNYGAKQAKGKYVYFVDADFILQKQVIKECVEKIKKGFDAIVVHNTPDESFGLLAKIRKFEVDMYKYDLTHSAARFFKKVVFEAIGGYDPELIAGEDYEIQSRLRKNGYKTGFIKAQAIHIGEESSFFKLLKKYFFYGKQLVKYTEKDRSNAPKKLAFFRKPYFKNWRKFVNNPLIAILFLIYHVLKYSAGALGYLSEKFFPSKNEKTS